MSTSKRVHISLTTHTNSAITASKRFAKKLFLSGYDWSYYWAIDQDEDTFYAWFIERDQI